MWRNRLLRAVVLVGVVLGLANPGAYRAQGRSGTATPIRHLVVIFQENVSFDHYFATYPIAANPPGEPPFVVDADDGQDPVENLLSICPTCSANYLTANPNTALPFRLDRAQNYTCDLNHDGTSQQESADGGLMDRFVQFSGAGLDGSCQFGSSLPMGYYDGNTVTALWRYAHQFAMNDHSFGTIFGPSAPGAINLISGQTAGIDMEHTRGDVSGDLAGGSLVGDADPFYDDCSTREQLALTGKNIGDLLNAAGITWGWFQGGFAPSAPATATTPAACGAQSTRLDGATSKNYVPHHEPFQFYASTANPHHLPPSSVAMIGHTDQANHQYDLADFWRAVNSGNMPAVSFLKAKDSQNAHPEDSSPLDEQAFLVNIINVLQQRPEWEETAVIIAYDDSGDWYDHVTPPPVNPSSTWVDALSGAGSCDGPRFTTAPLGGFQGRCGYGPRLPLLVLSHWVKPHTVDHTVTDQTSILRFIEDNWLGGERIGGGSFDALAGSLENMFSFHGGPHAHRLLLDPVTGEPIEKDQRP